MGEYAKRKSDGLEVKIGTCENMYYLRYDRRNEVDYDFGNYKWNWRIPTPDEDDVRDGEFGGLLVDGKYIPHRLGLIYDIPEDVQNEIASYEGLMQIHDNKCGLLANIPCYHGIKLPEGTDKIKFHWNGKSDCIYLAFLQNGEKELLVGTQCKMCRKMLIWSFSEICPLMNSLWMKLRLLHQCTDYWYEHNDEPCTYSVTDKDSAFQPMEIYNLSGKEDGWIVAIDDNMVATGNWYHCRNEFIKRLGYREHPDPIYNAHFRYYDEIREMKRRYL